MWRNMLTKEQMHMVFSYPIFLFSKNMMWRKNRFGGYYIFGNEKSFTFAICGKCLILHLWKKTSKHMFCFSLNNGIFLLPILISRCPRVFMMFKCYKFLGI